MAPKGLGNRRRYGQPSRGEWTDLEDEVLEPVLPVFHPDMTCPQWMWEAWRWDPVTLVYTKADVAFVCELGHRYAEMKHSEQRLRADTLGLTPKGKRDLRWRTPLEKRKQEESAVRATELRRKIRVTAPKEDAA